MHDTPPYDEAQFALLTAGYLTLGVLLARHLWTHRRAAMTRQGAMLAAITALAFIVRVAIRPPTVLYENGHGYRYIGMAIDPASDLHVYGSGFQALFHILYSVLPPVTQVVLYGNAALGALTALLGGLLMARLFGPPSGIFAALTLAVLPAHIRMSGTESPYVLAMALATLALWAAVELRLNPSWPLAVVTAVATSAACQVRVELSPVVLLAVFALYVTAGHGVDFIRRRELHLMLGLLVLFTARHVTWLYHLHVAGGGSQYHQFVKLHPLSVLPSLWSHAALLDPGMTPPLFIALAVGGILIAARAARAPAVVLAVSWVATTYLYAGRAGFHAEALRTSTPSQVVLAFLCGPALAWLAARISRSYPAAAAAGLSALLGSAFLSHRPLTTTTPDEIEYHFLQDAYSRLPAGCALVLPPRRMANNQVESHFPYYEYRYRVGIPNPTPPVPLRADAVDAAHFANAHCVVYYDGLSCASYADGEALDSPTRLECNDVRKHWQLTPLATQAVHPRPWSSHRFRLPRVDFVLGFYAVTLP